MHIAESSSPSEWDTFLCTQRFSPFLQSWTMGEVYRDIGQEPVRLEVRDDSGALTGICSGHIVPARRGRHLAVPYGPVLESMADLPLLLVELKRIACGKRCSFIRISPFWTAASDKLQAIRCVPSPLHLLAEHVWYLPLHYPDRWDSSAAHRYPLAAAPAERRTEEELLSDMRATTRNLIHRAEREGVTVEASGDPVSDLHHFLMLHDETRKRHSFTPYPDAFFRAQVDRFAAKKHCTLYLARYRGEVIATSIHMHVGGETSYHHGASTHRYSKIPASYLLQWTAMTDALKRGDAIYNFWGTAPLQQGAELLHSTCQMPSNTIAKNDRNRIVNCPLSIVHPSHPFAGVTLFKTGFGGKPLNLIHCVDIPLSPTYRVTRAFEIMRKWRRGF